MNRIRFSSFLDILTFGRHLTPRRVRRTSIVLCYSNRTVRSEIYKATILRGHVAEATNLLCVLLEGDIYIHVVRVIN
jgi:hypothetical protein